MQALSVKLCGCCLWLLLDSVSHLGDLKQSEVPCILWYPDWDAAGMLSFVLHRVWSTATGSQKLAIQFDDSPSYCLFKVAAGTNVSNCICAGANLRWVE